MKYFTKTIAAYILLFLLSTGSVAYAFPKPTLSKKKQFLILIEKNGNHVKLSGIKGCAFKTVSFNLKEDDEQVIDQFGMGTTISNKNTKDDPGTFLFTIKNNKGGFSLVGKEGTAWENLSFGCVTACSQLIDEHGMRGK